MSFHHQIFTATDVNMSTFISFLCLMIIHLVYSKPIESSQEGPKITHRDIAIIGSETAGVYAAIRLQQHDKDFVLIDQGSELASSIGSYRDPKTGFDFNVAPVQESGHIRGLPTDRLTRSIFDYVGVKALNNREYADQEDSKINETMKYMMEQGKKMLDYEMTKFERYGSLEYVDFSTGEKREREFRGYKTPATIELMEYWKIKDSFKMYIDKTFNFPSTIPVDLVVPSGMKIALQYVGGLVRKSIRQGCDGMIDVLLQPLLYSFKFCSAGNIQNVEDIFEDGQARMKANDSTPAPFNTDTLLGKPRLRPSTIRHFYEKAEMKLKSSIMFNTKVRQIAKTMEFIDIHVFRDGQEELIRVKKLIISEQPNKEVIDWFTGTEQSRDYWIFGKFIPSYLYTTLVKDNFLDPSVVYLNAPSNTTLNMPTSPDVYQLAQPELNNLRVIHLTEKDSITMEAARSEILSRLQLMASKMTRVLKRIEGPEFEILKIYEHKPYMMTLSIEDIQRGTYSKINELQGKHDIFWVGSAFSSHWIDQQWAWVEERILPKILGI